MFAKVAQLFPGTIVQNYGQTHLQRQQCFWNYNRAFQGSSSGGKRYKIHLQLVMSILDAIRTRNNDHWELQWQWLTSISITIQHQNLTSLPQFWKWHWHNEELHGNGHALHSCTWQYNDIFLISSSSPSSPSSWPPSPSFDDIDRTCDESGGDSSNSSARQMAFEPEIIFIIMIMIMIKETMKSIDTRQRSSPRI